MRKVMYPVFYAEDGTRFFDQNDAATYEALLYMQATMAAFGPEEVMLAVNQVQTADPAFTAGIRGVATILQRRHGIIPDGLSAKLVKSVNAPDNVRSPDAVEKFSVPAIPSPEQDPDVGSGGSTLLRRLGSANGGNNSMRSGETVTFDGSGLVTGQSSTAQGSVNVGDDITARPSGGASSSDTLSGASSVVGAAGNDLLAPRPDTSASDAATVAAIGVTSALKANDVIAVDGTDTVRGVTNVPVVTLPDTVSGGASAPVVVASQNPVDLGNTAPEPVVSTQAAPAVDTSGAAAIAAAVASQAAAVKADNAEQADELRNALSTKAV